MFRKIFATSITMILLLSFAAPALAITYGQPDGNAHPYVGNIIVYHSLYEKYYQWCTGTLIDLDVFLTAGHCMRQLKNILNNFDGSQVWVTFDETLEENPTLYEIFDENMVVNPDYSRYKGQYGLSDPSDLGVVLLPVAPSIQPANLPTLGLLDQLKADGLLKGEVFRAVGYGDSRDTNRTGWQDITYSEYSRRYSDGEFLSLTDTWLTLSENLATGNGGICGGDDGGPHFIKIDGMEILVSTTAVMDSQCKALDKTYRIDTPSARSFLGQYVTLP